MKKRATQILTIGLLYTVLLGCNNVSKDDYESLKAENEKLKQEIEELKFGADKLLSKAKIYLEKKEFSKAKTELKAILDRYPTSYQSTEAEELYYGTVDSLKELELIEEKAKADKEKADKERLVNATRKMRVKVDDMKNITWYYDKSSPQYINQNGFYSYIGKMENSNPFLRLQINYAANDWLFIDSYIIKVDDEIYNITQSSYGEIKRDNGNGGIWEWLDRNVGISEYNMIRAVAYGKDVKIRFVGDDYYKDKTITEQQKTALRNVLDAFYALGGTTNFN
jgi:glycerol kinase